MTALTSLKKDALIKLIGERDAALVAAGRKLEALRLELSIARAQAPLRAAPGPKPQAESYTDYWEYVRAARAWHIARGDKIVTYATREQFNAAHAGVPA